VELPCRPLIFVAHPDDESLACSGLIQRVETALVVFATDGAAPGFGGERISGSLKAYSDARFLEACRALTHVSHASFHRLTKPDAAYFVEVHLWEELPDAFAALCMAARSYSPDAIISHAYEGGHLDHDACSFLATHGAAELSLPHFEFPLYWSDANGNVVRQTFRDSAMSASTANRKIELHLTESEIHLKRKMLAEYHTQRGTSDKARNQYLALLKRHHLPHKTSRSRLPQPTIEVVTIKSSCVNRGIVFRRRSNVKRRAKTGWIALRISLNISPTSCLVFWFGSIATGSMQSQGRNARAK
jgi:LmbE family N-acetylglucosaminyl deacetylase